MTNPITAITPPATITTTAPSAASVAAAANQGQLSSQQFLQLMVAQLQYQDPSNPVDNSTLMNETATLNQIQTMQQLATSSTSQMQAEQQQTAASMVGKTITYTDSSGNLQGGLVSAATISGTTPTLTVGGQVVDLSAVQQVTMAAS
jgi:flagellar basal-body rod modification protein FlgD